MHHARWRDRRDPVVLGNSMEEPSETRSRCSHLIVERVGQLWPERFTAGGDRCKRVATVGGIRHSRIKPETGDFKYRSNGALGRSRR